MFLGDSWTFGYSVDIKDRWTTRLCEYLDGDIAEWNFGSPGSSNDYISRIALASTEYLKPDIVFVLFSRYTRREYIDDSTYLMYCRGWREREVGKPPFNYKILNSFDMLNSHENNYNNLRQNYKFIEWYYNSIGVDWYFSLVPASVTNKGKVSRLQILEKDLDFIDESRFIGNFDLLDTATDGFHPGEESHKEFSKKCQKAIGKSKKPSAIEKKGSILLDSKYCNDAISRKLDNLSNPPEKAYIEFSDIHRRDYFESGIHFVYGEKPKNLIERDIHEAFKTVNSYCGNLLNFRKNFKMVESYMKNHDVDWRYKLPSSTPKIKIL